MSKQTKKQPKPKKTASKKAGDPAFIVLEPGEMYQEMDPRLLGPFESITDAKTWATKHGLVDSDGLNWDDRTITGGYWVNYMVIEKPGEFLKMLPKLREYVTDGGTYPVDEDEED